MLVLGRKPGEYVVIDNHIIVKVIKGTSGQLRLAIDAPKEVPIVRGEVHEEKLAQKVVIPPKPLKSNKAITPAS
ncbi:carbon storage regulator [Gracilibacillus sp. YIM 98692]|uniref:carbon storage regulator n=1 Tax=Gracilibacillus sp. YIM 98692 TaxID=2663532 RepID=UPI0013D504C8|nr:carbon storage regulator [Gracilibacillus sp. YIM 98692]